MIAISKEFKQTLREVFESRGVTEISAIDLVELLTIDLQELEFILNDASLKLEYKLLQANDGNKYVKRFLSEELEGEKMLNAFKIRWDNIGGCPCFTCYELEKCDVGNPISSVDCPLFARWLFFEPTKVEEEK